MIREEVIFILFGFFKSFKPSEPFLTPYLQQFKGLTNQQVKDEIYPIWSYSNLALIIPLTLFAETIGYRPVIYLKVYLSTVLGHLATRAILIWGTGLRWMQTMQITYGVATAGELVYYAYVFKVFPAIKYQKVTTFSRTGVLIGHCLGSLLGQLLLSFNDNVKLDHLFWISAISVTIAAFVSLFFPKPRSDGHVDNVLGYTDDLEKEPETEQEKKSEAEQEKEPLILPQSQNVYFPIIAIVPPILIYAFNLAHLYNIEGYSSVLWSSILKELGFSKDRGKILNGYADVGGRGLGAIFALLAWSFLQKQELLSKSKLYHSRYLLISISLFLISMCTVLQILVKDIYISYGIFMLSVGLGGSVSAIASAWMGQTVSKVKWISGRYAFVFGKSSLLCAGTQALMLVVLSNINIGITVQFMVYALFISTLTFFTIISWIVSSRNAKYFA